MIPTLDIALRIWITDEGYRKINSILLGPTYKYFRKDYTNIEFEDEEYSTSSVIQVIRQNMKRGNREMTYYRGDDRVSQKSFVRKTFTSLSRDKEQAETFIDDHCCLYTVVVDADVKRIPTGVEGEILLENDVYWKYLDNNRVHVYKPGYTENNTSDEENIYRSAHNYIYSDEEDDYTLGGGRRRSVCKKRVLRRKTVSRKKWNRKTQKRKKSKVK